MNGEQFTLFRCCPPFGKSLEVEKGEKWAIRWFSIVIPTYLSSLIVVFFSRFVTDL